jgi:hypothetical protein
MKEKQVVDRQCSFRRIVSWEERLTEKYTNKYSYTNRRRESYVFYRKTAKKI